MRSSPSSSIFAVALVALSAGCSGEGSSSGPLPTGGGPIADAGDAATTSDATPPDAAPDSAASRAALDRCPGLAESPAIDTPLTLSDTTAGLSGDYASYCGIGTGSGADAVYALKAPADGTLKAQLATSNGLRGVVYVQTDCGATNVGSFLDCQEATDAPAAIAIPAVRGQTYYVFVDGRDGTAGPYTLTTVFARARCGDGVINVGEQCDFGTKNGPGSGCTADCTFEAPTDESDKCPGQPESVSPSTPITIAGHTTGYNDDGASKSGQTCTGGGSDGGRGSPDRIFAVTPTASGTLTAAITAAEFDQVLYVLDKCGDSSTQIACSDDGNDTSKLEQLSFPVKASQTYYVVVDGYASYSYGDFTLKLTLAP